MGRPGHTSLTGQFQASSSSKPSQPEQRLAAGQLPEPAKPAAPKQGPHKVRIANAEEERQAAKELARLKRMEVFYTFSGLAQPKRRTALVKAKKRAEESDRHLNSPFLASDSLKAVQETLRLAFQKTETLPSDCDRRHRDTYRLFFKRRQTRECSTLVIVKASDLILKIEHGLQYNDAREEVCYVRQAGLDVLAELSKTCQVALLVDYADREST